MDKIIIKGRGCGGRAEGEALVSNKQISFYSDIDPATGEVVNKSTLPEIFGKTITNKILVFNHGKGGTWTTWILPDMVRAGTAPKAIVMREVWPIMAEAALMAEIPVVDRFDRDPLEIIETGDWIVVDGDKGTVTITKKRE